VFAVGVPLMALAWITVLFLRELPLRDTPGLQRAATSTAEAVD
jgi:hypothetical protein